MPSTKAPTEVIPPEVGTRAALSYFWSNTCDLRLLGFLTHTTISGDFIHRIARDALEGKNDYQKLDPSKLARSNPGPRTQELRASSQEFVEMFLSRAVDSFQVYIVEILREVLHKQPKILSASKQELTLGYVLQFDSIESLTKDWIEGKVAGLSYEGFGELEEWCKSRGIPLLVPDGKHTKIVEAIAIRNLIVHNRGVVDERYKKATGDTRFDVGSQRALDVEDFIGTTELLAKVVKITDGAVLGKFGLNQVNVRDELDERSEKRWPRQKKPEGLAGPATPEREVVSYENPPTELPPSSAGA